MTTFIVLHLKLSEIADMHNGMDVSYSIYFYLYFYNAVHIYVL